MELLKKLLKKMKWYDISLLKLSVFFATLFLLTAWTGFRNLALSIGWQWYLLLMAIFAFPLCKKMFAD